MKLSITTTALQLGTAAFKVHSYDFDFGRTIHDNASPVERIRQLSTKVSKVLFVDEVGFGETQPNSKSLKQPHLHESMSHDLFSHPRGGKASKVFMSTAFSYDQAESFARPRSINMEGLSYDFSDAFVDTKAESSSTMSYSFVPGFLPSSPPSFVTLPGSTQPTASQTADVDDSIANPGQSGENESNSIAFKYLNECAGANLDIESCLVSNSLDILVNYDPNGNGVRRLSFRRFLQSVNNTDLPAVTPLLAVAGKNFSTAPVVNDTNHYVEMDDGVQSDECGPPLDIDEALMRTIVLTAKDQCPSVSGDEYEGTIQGFLKILRSDECWDTLCGESSPGELFFIYLIEEVAKCVGVNVDDIPQCVLSHVFGVISHSDTPVTRFRRSLQGTTSCEQPSTVDLSFFVSFLMMEAESSCSAAGITLNTTTLEKTGNDLIQIFGASSCWGGNCDGIQGSVEHQDKNVTVSIGSIDPHLSNESQSPTAHQLNDTQPTIDPKSTIGPQPSIASQENSGLYTTLIVSGSVVTIVALIIAGANRMKKDNNPIHPDTKDTVSTNDTAELNYSRSDDRSELSSNMSPTNQKMMAEDGMMAQEEEANWCNSGVLQESSTGSSLDQVSEVSSTEQSV